MSEVQQQRPLALVFTDIEGSSQLWEAHGGAFLKALEKHDALLTGACREFGGRVVKNEGDAFFLVFEEPRLTLQFALRAQELLQAYDWQQHLPEALQVRVGLHYGVVFERGGDYFGTEVNRTARLCDAGHGGQILASEELLDACGEALPNTVITDLARHRLRGLAAPQHLYQVTLAHWERQEWPVLRTLDDVPTNLPAQVTSFVGREQDLERVAELLADPQVRLLTLTGPGGTGKSRLAQEAAAHALAIFPDGVFWVSLAEFSTVEAVPAAIMQALKLQPQAGQSATAVIAAHARDRQLLLVLDNFEHLIDAADFLAELLRLSAGVRLLVTSREVLHLQAEQLFHVLPLSLPAPPLNYQTLSQYESVQLFLHRARAVSPDFVITEENAAAIAEICLRLDGIPLALELAAAWVRVYPPLQILQRLGGRSQILTSRIRGVAERQRTVAGTIDWSYRLLSPEEQRTLRWLAVFRSGFFLEAAEAVCGAAATENVITLFDKSLLYPKTVLGQQRFYMLDIIREFALSQLNEAGEAAEATAAHHSHFDRCMTDWLARQRGPYPAGAQQEMQAEVFDLLSALEYALDQGLTANLCPWSHLIASAARPHGSACAGALQTVLDKGASLAHAHLEEEWARRLIQQAHSNLSNVGLSQQQIDQAEHYLGMLDACGDEVLALALVYSTAGAAVYLRRCDLVRHWLAEADRRSAGMECVGTFANYVCYSYAGMYEEGIASALKVLASLDRKDPQAWLWTTVVLAELYAFSGQTEKALTCVEAAMAEEAVLVPISNRRVVLKAIGLQSYAAAGDQHVARRLAHEGLDIALQLPAEARAMAVGNLFQHCAMARLWDLGMELFRRVDAPWPADDLVGGHRLRGAMCAAAFLANTGHPEEAISLAQAALDTPWDWTRPTMDGGIALTWLAEVLCVADKLPEAAVVVAAALGELCDQPLLRSNASELWERINVALAAKGAPCLTVESESVLAVDAIALARQALGLDE